MQYHWINRNNNKNLIIFFSGWSFDYKPFEKLNSSGYDILFIYNYTDIGEIYNNPDYNIIPDIITQTADNVKNKYLITWSMGVYVAYILRKRLPDFTCKIAVNGTPYPINDNLGIPNKTFDLTLKYVETGLQGKFQQNLFKRKTDYEKYLETPVERSIADRSKELFALSSFIKKQNIDYSSFYDYAIISDTDKIIPTKNQIKFWENSVPVVTLDNGHFPFFSFESWEDILKCIQI